MVIVSYIDEKLDLCLLMVSANNTPDQFHNCQKARHEIEPAHRAIGLLRRKKSNNFINGIKIYRYFIILIYFLYNHIL